MPPQRRRPHTATESPVELGALELDELSQEERISLAIDAINRQGFKPNGRPIYPMRVASRDYQVPLSTLSARFNGRRTREEGHAHEKTLTKGQEDILAEWIKERGRRNISLSLTMVAEHAKLISGSYVGVNWVKRFRTRRDDLKKLWTTGQEKCRAQALNATSVAHFYTLLDNVVRTYNIKPENVYNADEKGCQLGVGKSVCALVDRDQKRAEVIEDGNRELVTTIECICADGTAIPPTVIYKGTKRDLEWGRDNPCKASISHSPNGWTDKELGAMWLENHFEPETRKKLDNDDEYRLLILDGHTSHVTYRFMSFAERHKIIVVLLPPHTTHALQPCDVGVFGPLAHDWKLIVTRLSMENLPIRKSNFLRYYHEAREKALTETNIRSAWRKTGIVPFNPNAIPESAFAPALNTTTKPAQLLPTEIPTIVVTPDPTAPAVPTSTSDESPIPPSQPSTSSSRRSSSSSVTSDHSSLFSDEIPEELSDSEFMGRMTTDSLFQLVGMPRVSGPRAGVNTLRDENHQLRAVLEHAVDQMQRDYAQKKLMDRENGRLRAQLFEKENKPKKKQTTAFARHMTSEEMLIELGKADWKEKMKAVFSSEDFKRAQGRYEAYEKSLQEEQKQQEKDAKEREKQRKQAETRERNEAKKAEKRAVAVEKKVAREAVAAEKKAAKATAAAEKKAAAAAKKAAAAAAKAAAPKKKGGRKKTTPNTDVEDEPADEEAPSDNEKSLPDGDPVLYLATLFQPPRPNPRRIKPKPPVDVGAVTDSMADIVVVRRSNWIRR